MCGELNRSCDALFFSSVYIFMMHLPKEFDLIKDTHYTRCNPVLSLFSFLSKIIFSLGICLSSAWVLGFPCLAVNIQHFNK